MKYKLIIDRDKEPEVVVTAREPNELTAKIEMLVLAYEGNDSVTAYSEDELTRLSYADIECITVIDRKVIAITEGGKQYRLKERLCELESQLPSYFMRINKSTLANSRRIVRFKTAFSGAVDAVFRCGYVDYVSRRCFSDIKRRFEQ
ncbi:MAG: LytTR family transcriptional regulator [Clostridia bacterium]|nr:LytTR family transcriptional regulator [Clostridia bacterium]